MKPRLLFFLPCSPQAQRGNGTTARRLATELERRGYESKLIEAAQLPRPQIEDWQPQLLLGMHAVHTGPLCQELAQAHGLPYVLLFSGTDLNGRPPLAATVAAKQAAAVVALGRAAAKRARDIYPECKDHLHVIPQGVAPLPYRPGLQLPADAPSLAANDSLVLVPAGVRAIKDPLRAVHALAPLQQEIPSLRLWFVGPELEEKTGQLLRTACATYAWVHWLPPRPRQELLPLLRRSQVVLSTSRSEGGPPNSLLEAVLAGRPVLASSIPAHREFPGTESCFRNDSELRRLLRRILEHPEKAMVQVRKMEEILRQVHSPAAESLAWDRLLRPLLSA